jgi:TPR repeat protein
MKFKSLLVVLVSGLICLPLMSCGEDLSVLRQKAGQGNADAQFNLGYAYANGEGVPKDYKEAVKWYRLAAEQGDAFAQFNLGLSYAKGIGVPQDYKEAVKWFRLAAEQGRAEAQLNLGVHYYTGKGVPQDYKEAIKWYRLAAEQGDAFAQFNLGDAYANGKGVPKDYKETLKWYRLAAEQEYAPAQYSLGSVYYFGKGVPQDYKEAVKWYRLAAEQGIAEAQFKLGGAYDFGKGVPKDYTAAAKWYRLAAEQGDAGAQYGLGAAYYLGNGVSQDYVQAYAWVNLAASQGDQEAVKIRSSLLKLMTPAQIAEGQRLFREYKKQVVSAPAAPAMITDPKMEVIPKFEDTIPVDESQNQIPKYKDGVRLDEFGEPVPKFEDGVVIGPVRELNPILPPGFIPVPDNEQQTVEFCVLNPIRAYPSAQYYADHPESRGSDAEIQNHFMLSILVGQDPETSNPQDVRSLAFGEKNNGLEYSIQHLPGIINFLYDVTGVRKAAKKTWQDDKEAAKWCQFIAEQGEAKEQYILAHKFFNDKNGSIGLVEALKWYRLAAEQRNIEAQKTLGQFLEQWPDEAAEAVKWYRLAAEQGDGEAQFRLGRCYQSGNGVPKNLIKTAWWYHKAAAQGHSAAQEWVECFYLNCLAILIGLATLFALIRWRIQIWKGLVRNWKALSAWGVWGILLLLYCLLFDTDVSIGLALFPPVALTVIYIWWRLVNKPKK